jgi:hypothetical protein
LFLHALKYTKCIYRWWLCFISYILMHVKTIFILNQYYFQFYLFIYYTKIHYFDRSWLIKAIIKAKNPLLKENCFYGMFYFFLYVCQSHNLVLSYSKILNKMYIHNYLYLPTNNFQLRRHWYFDSCSNWIQPSYLSW